MNLDRIIDAETMTGRKKSSVRLAEEERTELVRRTATGRTATGRTAARRRRHAWVLLKADAAPAGPGWTDDQLRDAYGVSIHTIGRIRPAFVAEGLDTARRGQPRAAPRPRTIDGEQQAPMVALLCGPVPVGHARWSVRLLADRFVQRAGSGAVSRETVRRTLTKPRAHAVAPDAMVHPARGTR